MRGFIQSETMFGKVFCAKQHLNQNQDLGFPTERRTVATSGFNVVADQRWCLFTVQTERILPSNSSGAPAVLCP